MYVIYGRTIKVEGKSTVEYPCKTEETRKTVLSRPETQGCTSVWVCWDPYGRGGVTPVGGGGLCRGTEVDVGTNGDPHHTFVMGTMGSELRKGKCELVLIKTGVYRRPHITKKLRKCTVKLCFQTCTTFTSITTLVNLSSVLDRITNNVTQRTW